MKFVLLALIILSSCSKKKEKTPDYILTASYNLTTIENTLSNFPFAFESFINPQKEYELVNKFCTKHWDVILRDLRKVKYILKAHPKKVDHFDISIRFRYEDLVPKITGLKTICKVID